MNKLKFVIYILIVLTLLLACTLQQKTKQKDSRVPTTEKEKVIQNLIVNETEDFPPFSGQVIVKLNVTGKPSSNVAGVLDYEREAIKRFRQELIKQLGSDAKIKEYRNDSILIDLPFLILDTARVEDLKVLEKSDLVEFFYSDESAPVTRDPIDDMPGIGQPRFQWIYTKEYGYQIGASRSPHAKKLDPELIYEIYRTEGKNIPKEIIDEWNRIK